MSCVLGGRFFKIKRAIKETTMLAKIKEEARIPAVQKIEPENFSKKVRI